MDQIYPAIYLEAQWRIYLEESGHYIYKSKTRLGLIRSRNGKKKRYRWLVFISRCPVRHFTESEIKLIQQQLELARQRRERIYLVIGLAFEPGRIVVIPADRVLKKGYARVDMGGIDWNDWKLFS